MTSRCPSLSSASTKIYSSTGMAKSPKIPRFLASAFLEVAAASPLRS